jgi:predicted DNA-binding antitoxin AbrB/MazE fold protein
MTHVDAVYQNGVFKPLGAVEVTENQRVHLNVEPAKGEDAKAWLESVRQFQQDFIQRKGVLPDSAMDIAADRLR